MAATTFRPRAMAMGAAARAPATPADRCSWAGQPPTSLLPSRHSASTLCAAVSISATESTAPKFSNGSTATDRCERELATKGVFADRQPSLPNDLHPKALPLCQSTYSHAYEGGSVFFQASELPSIHPCEVVSTRP